MTDRILIKDLLLRCIIGINEDEREKKQDVLINLEITTEFDEAIRSDSTERALDYKKLTKKIIGHVEASHFFLIESLASSIADMCLSEPGAAAVRVTVEKPGALRFARSVGVEITRTGRQRK